MIHNMPVVSQESCLLTLLIFVAWNHFGVQVEIELVPVNSTLFFENDCCHFCNNINIFVNFHELEWLQFVVDG